MLRRAGVGEPRVFCLVTAGGLPALRSWSRTCRSVGERPAARWRVRLNGAAIDLEDVVEPTTSPDLRVVEEGGDFLLESAKFERLDGSVEVLEAGARAGDA